MKKQHLLQNLIATTGNVYDVQFLMNNKHESNGIFLFDLFELLKAFNEKLLIVYANIRV